MSRFQTLWGYKFLLLFFTSCITNEQPEFIKNIGLNTSDCQLLAQVNGDSRFVKYRCVNGWEIEIDYGFGVYSFHQTYSANDYLSRRVWLSEVLPKLHKITSETKLPSDSLLMSVKVLSINDSLVATLAYRDELLKHKIQIPESFRDIQEKSKTEEGVYKRLLYNSIDMKSFDYYLINEMNILNGFPESLAIRIRTSDPASLEGVESFLNSVKLPNNDGY